APDPQPMNGLCFSPDGAQLAAATDGPGVQLWDLRLIRRQLAVMGLDRDQPPFLPSPPRRPISSVRVDDGQPEEPSRGGSVPTGQ
ncbi:MAG TPA: hypothetical protein VF590_16230, partial [Isosphaeraceae bacterium]